MPKSIDFIDFFNINLRQLFLLYLFKYLAMKRLLITLSIVIISVVAFYLYNTSAYKQVRNVFKQIDNGELSYFTRDTSTFITDNSGLLTYDKIISSLIDIGGISKSRQYLNYEKVYFNLPDKDANYKIISERKYIDNLKKIWGGKIETNPVNFWEIKCKVSSLLADEYYTLLFIKYGREYKLAAMMKN
jgi:hypothetical protein